MNILYIDHYFGSPSMGMEYRPYYMAREWTKSGHRVLCVAAGFAHTRHTQPKETGICQIDGQDFLILPTREYKGNGVARVLNMFDFMRGLFGAARKVILDFKPDVVIASSTYTFDNWAAGHYAKKCGARFIYELHDIWPLSIMELGGMAWYHPFVWLLQRAENYACRHADKVVSMLPCAEPHLKEHGLEDGKFSYVPNGILPEDWAEPLPVPAEHVGALEELRKRVKFVVGYAGAHGPANELETLVKAARDPRLADVGVAFVGKGPERDRLIALSEEVKDRVRFLGSVPKKAIPSYLPMLDALYVGLPPCSLFRFGVSPNKVFDYMMAGRPIVFAIKAGNDLVQEAQCGESVPPQDVEALVNAIVRLRDKTTAEREQLGSNGKAFVRKQHLIPTLAQNFIKAMEG